MKKYDIGKHHMTLPEFNGWLNKKAEDGYHLMGPPQFEMRGSKYLIVYCLEKNIDEGPSFRVEVDRPNGGQMEEIQLQHDGKKKRTK